MTSNQEEHASLFGILSSTAFLSNNLSKPEENSLSGEISSLVAIGGTVTSTSPVAETYIGPYEAPALFEPQVYGTAGFLMAEDFKVAAINYTEAPNEDGITATTGG